MLQATSLRDRFPAAQFFVERTQEKRFDQSRNETEKEALHALALLLVLG
jgi:hypothetical protein